MIKLTPTLTRYIAQRYVVNLLILLGALLSVILIFDMVELIRRASKFDNVPISLVVQMSLLKLPEVGQMLFPFAILFSAIFTLWHLTRRYELIVVRASGFSIWQFLAPIMGVAVLSALLLIMVINPIGAVLISKYEHLERKHLNRQENDIAVFEEGLWLRQAILIDAEATNAQGEKELISGYVVLHAQKVEQPEWILKNVVVLYFTDDNSFFQRVDAATATLEGGYWIMKDAVVHKNNRASTRHEFYSLPSVLTVQDIEESFSSPRSMSFWKLPGYIRTVEQTGFDASRLKVYYQNLLSQPLMFVAMILLAATVSMRPPRNKGTFILICIGVFMGFIIFFLSSFLQAMGASQQIPVTLAAWAPAIICFLLGLTMMMNLEDG